MQNQKNLSEKLISAITQNNKPEVQNLLSQGADVNFVTSENETPLFIAINHGRKDIIPLLIENGANVNYADFAGITALFCAIGHQDKETVSLLLKNGADVNHKEAHGLTPLFSAIYNTNKEIISLLVENGADLNYRGSTGLIAEEFAEMIGNVEIVQMLKKAKNKSTVNAFTNEVNFTNKELHSESSIQTAKPTATDFSTIENSNTFKSALVSFSKIIAKYGEEILISENTQKLIGLIADLFPQDNEFYSKLKQSISCDFTQIILDATDKSEIEQHDILGKTVDKIVTETNLTKEDAVLITRLFTLSLGWE